MRIRNADPVTPVFAVFNACPKNCGFSIENCAQSLNLELKTAQSWNNKVLVPTNNQHQVTPSSQREAEREISRSVLIVLRRAVPSAHPKFNCWLPNWRSCWLPFHLSVVYYG
jgi:hypothetical protein